MSSKKRCKLDAISNPILNGISLGVDFSGLEPKLCEKTFTCCEGSGLIMEDQKVNICRVKSRFNQICELHTQYKYLWQESEPFTAYLDRFKKWDSDILKAISSIVKGYAPQCRVIENSSANSLKKPSPLWAMAISSSWRFGIPAKLIHFPKLNGKELARLGSIKSDSNRSFLLVENISELYIESKAIQLEYIISMCYSTNTYLILEILDMDKKTYHDNKRTSKWGALNEVFYRKNNYSENQSFHNFLDKNVLSKLSSLRNLPNPAHLSNLID